MSASWELQKAIYGVLNAALTAPVYSLGNVPHNLKSVYAVVGDSTLVPHDSDLQLGFECTVKIDTWDNNPRSRGFGKLKPLMGEVYNALNRATFTVSGYTLVDIQAEYEQPMLDPDGVTTHGVQRFRAILTTE
jgi:hypothetical protein